MLFGKAHSSGSLFKNQEKNSNSQGGAISCVNSIWEVPTIHSIYAEVIYCTVIGKHPVYQMNMISKTNKTQIIPAEQITRGTNVQHNCTNGECQHIQYTNLHPRPRQEASLVDVKVQPISENMFEEAIMTGQKVWLGETRNIQAARKHPPNSDLIKDPIPNKSKGKQLQIATQSNNHNTPINRMSLTDAVFGPGPLTECSTHQNSLTNCLNLFNLMLQECAMSRLMDIVAFKLQHMPWEEGKRHIWTFGEPYMNKSEGEEHFIPPQWGGGTGEVFPLWGKQWQMILKPQYFSFPKHILKLASPTFKSQHFVYLHMKDAFSFTAPQYMNNWYKSTTPEAKCWAQASPDV
ncbi:hypothetical protein VP01_2339g4 [Puccinia sorghi]|uniref:Uncharacterized protein n=1 Tax=Puccinia sorghi TaxID=27349 RepID=A0A0L6V7D0_9BASI|nr:hypothetical protein VP01_2339g4 [Puccinia sorghi]